MSNKIVIVFDSYEEWYNKIHPKLERSNPELYKVVKRLSDKELDTLVKNGLKLE